MEVRDRRVHTDCVTGLWLITPPTHMFPGGHAGCPTLRHHLSLPLLIPSILIVTAFVPSPRLAAPVPQPNKEPLTSGQIKSRHQECYDCEGPEDVQARAPPAPHTCHTIVCLSLRLGVFEVPLLFCEILEATVCRKLVLQSARVSVGW